MKWDCKIFVDQYREVYYESRKRNVLKKISLDSGGSCSGYAAWCFVLGMAEADALQHVRKKRFHIPNESLFGFKHAVVKAIDLFKNKLVVNNTAKNMTSA